MEKEKFIELIGNTNDLLFGSTDSTMRCTRLIDIDPSVTKIDNEIIDVCISSTSMNGDHKRFNKLVGKKIKITVDILE